MTKSLQEIRNQMKKLVEDVNGDKRYLYVVTCYEELTQYDSVIGYYDSYEDAQQAATKDAQENNNREDALNYYIDKYVYEDTVPAWKAEESVVAEDIVEPKSYVIRVWEGRCAPQDCPIEYVSNIHRDENGKIDNYETTNSFYDIMRFNTKEEAEEVLYFVTHHTKDIPELNIKKGDYGTGTAARIEIK